MKDKIINHSEWLEQQPVFEGDNKEVFENADGSQYIPVAIVEGLLDLLTDCNWSVTKFDCELVSILERETLSASINIVIKFNNIERNIIGVSDRKLSDFTAKNNLEKDNTDYQATMLSHCLCNAAKKLGNRFGRSLNGRGINKQENKKEIPLPFPDKNICAQYLTAVEEGDIQRQKTFLLIYDNQTLHNALKK